MRFKQSPNYWKGRGGMKITGIVLHITDSSFSSAYNTFINSNSYVSAHYLLSKENVVQFVKESDTAWGCGRMITPTWKGLKYAQFGGQNLSEYTGSDRGEQGHIIQPVWEKKLGGFKNVINPNFYTLNIEYAINNNIFPDIRSWRKWAKFIKELAEEHNLPMDSLRIVNHNEINRSKSCPGIWFSRFWAKLL